MNLEKSLQHTIVRLNKVRKNVDPAVHWTVTPELADFSRGSDALGILADKFLALALTMHASKAPLRVAVRSRSCMADLSKFFNISPRRWLQLSVSGVGENGLETAARGVLSDLGFRCSEWIGVESSDARMGVFHRGDSNDPDLILYVLDRGSRRHCDFLVPVRAAHYAASAAHYAASAGETSPPKG